MPPPLPHSYSSGEHPQADVSLRPSLAITYFQKFFCIVVWHHFDQWGVNLGFGFSRFLPADAAALCPPREAWPCPQVISSPAAAPRNPLFSQTCFLPPWLDLQWSGTAGFWAFQRWLLKGSQHSCTFNLNTADYRSPPTISYDYFFFFKLNTHI